MNKRTEDMRPAPAVQLIYTFALHQFSYITCIKGHGFKQPAKNVDIDLIHELEYQVDSC